MAEKAHPAINDIFPQKTKQERDQLRLLDYAYIGARYDTKFKISNSDLEPLSSRVKKLLGLTKKTCKEKIQRF